MTNKNKRLSIFLISALLFVLLFVGVGMSVQKTQDDLKTVSAANYTFPSMGNADNSAIDGYINAAWNGFNNPDPLSKYATNNDPLWSMWHWGKGTHFSYLDRDHYQKAEPNGAINWGNGQYTRVILIMNGYSISGEFLMNVVGTSAWNNIIFVDRVPAGVSGVSYNPNPDKYYTYNSSTGRYSTYSTSRPTNAQDVTDMPTFQTNTYIHVRGSAISPNSLSSTCNLWVRAAGSNGGNRGQIEFYDINIVGTQSRNGNYGMIVAEQGAYVYLYRCTLIGNVSSYWQTFGIMDSTSYGSMFSIVGCSVYGNRQTNANFAIQPAYQGAPSQSADISIHNYSKPNLYKSNIGAILDYATNYSGQAYTRAIYMKDVYLSNQLNNFQITSLQNLNFQNGFIELVYNVSLSTNGYPVGTNSNFYGYIVHGDNRSSAPKRGTNTLTLTGGTTSVRTAYDTAATNSKITINGATVKSISANKIPVTQSSGTSTVAYTNTVDTLNLNGGTVNVEGKVNTIPTVANGAKVNVKPYGTVNTITTNNGTTTVETLGALGTVTTNAGEISLAGTLETLENNENGTLHILSGGSYTVTEETPLKGTVNNEGTLTIAGEITISITNTGILNILADTEYTVNAGEELGGTVNNAGTLKVDGTVNNLGSNTGTVEIRQNAELSVRAGHTVEGTIDNSGTLEILGTVAAALTNQTIGTINVSGELKNLVSSTGTLNIKESGIYTVEVDKTVEGTVNNEGILNLAGEVNNLATNTGTLNILKEKTFTVEAGKNLEGTINNYGVLTLLGTIQNLNSNYGTLNIEQNVNFTVASDKEYFGAIHNKGTLTVQGTINSLISNSGNVTVEETGVLGIPTSGTSTHTITNKGLIKLAGRIDNLTQTDTATLQILEGAVFVVQNNTTIAGTVLNEGTLNLQGTVAKLINRGIVNIAGGTVTTFEENTGRINIANGITFTVDTNQAFGGTIDNQGTLILKGNVDTLINRGILQYNTGTITDLTNTDTGTFEIIETANFELAVGKVLSGKVVNKGTFIVNGIVDSVEESTGAITVSSTGSIKNIKSLQSVLNIEANGQATVDTIEADAEVYNFGTLGLSGKIVDITKLKNSGEFMILSGGSLELLAGQSIDGIVSNAGTLVVSGAINNLQTTNGTTVIKNDARITTLIMQGGVVRLETNTATLPEELLVGAGTAFYLNKDVTIKSLSNSGIANIFGTVNTIINNDGGILNIESGANVDLIESSGSTNVKAEATVNKISVQAGYTNIYNNSVINTIDLLKAGTLEIQGHAQLLILNRQFGHGKLIDHRGATSLQIVLWIVGIVVLLIIVAVIIMVVVSKKRGNRKFKKLSKERKALADVMYSARTENTAQAIINRANERAKEERDNKKD